MKTHFQIHHNTLTTLSPLNTTNTPKLVYKKVYFRGFGGDRGLGGLVGRA